MLLDRWSRWSGLICWFCDEYTKQLNVFSDKVRLSACLLAVIRKALAGFLVWIDGQTSNRRSMCGNHGNSTDKHQLVLNEESYIKKKTHWISWLVTSLITSQCVDKMQHDATVGIKYRLFFLIAEVGYIGIKLKLKHLPHPTSLVLMLWHEFPPVHVMITV